MAFYLLLASCGCVAGVTTVLFGFGGGFVVVPLLYQALTHLRELSHVETDSAMQIAVATSTCVMVFGSVMATLRHQRAGSLDWSMVRPLLTFIALGAAAGALTAATVHGEWLRWAFVGYLALTILDCLLRPGFLARSARVKNRATWSATAIAGLVIGWVAALLGVGGSVMTVPLLRRRGVSMTGATAMANPLSLPVALAGTATYAALGLSGMPSAGEWYLGYVDLRAFAVLVVGSVLGIRMASPLIGRIPDRVHANVYVGLLVFVLAVMVLG